MAILKIVTQPDETLRKKSKTVTEFGERLWQLLDDMRETMLAKGGIGIAAVQVGVLFRAALVSTPDGIVELINPSITENKGPRKGTEGCLSVPGVEVKVSRPRILTVCAFDRFSKPFTQTFTGLTAVCASHEIDHMDGKLMIDYDTRSKPV